MAETVHLFLKANGTDIKGESTQVSLGREGSIECLFLKTSLLTAREKGSGLATGRRQHEPLVIKKRVDKSTPLLLKALTKNEVIEGVFKFFRPSPTGDGTTQQFFTVKIEKGRIASHQIVSPDTFVPSTSIEPVLEQVEFVFHSITWTYEDGGVEHHDNWDNQT